MSLRFKDGTKRNAGRVPDEKWNQYKDLLCSLYREKPVSEVSRIMKDEHHFVASKGQFTARLHGWGVYKYRYDGRRLPKPVVPALLDRMSCTHEDDPTSMVRARRIESAEEVPPQTDAGSDVCMSMYGHGQHQSSFQVQSLPVYNAYRLNPHHYHQTASEDDSWLLNCITSPISPMQRFREVQTPELAPQSPLITAGTQYDEDPFLLTPQEALQLSYTDLDLPNLTPLDQPGMNDFRALEHSPCRMARTAFTLGRTDTASRPSTPSRIMQQASLSSSDFRLFDGEIFQSSMSAGFSMGLNAWDALESFPTIRPSKSRSVRFEVPGTPKLPETSYPDDRKDVSYLALVPKLKTILQLQRCLIEIIFSLNGMLNEAGLYSSPLVRQPGPSFIDAIESLVSLHGMLNELGLDSSPLVRQPGPSFVKAIELLVSLNGMVIQALWSLQPGRSLIDRC